MNIWLDQFLTLADITSIRLLFILHILIGVELLFASIVSQLDKCLKSKSIQGDKNDCTLYKITPRNAVKDL